MHPRKIAIAADKFLSDFLASGEAGVVLEKEKGENFSKDALERAAERAKADVKVVEKSGNVFMINHKIMRKKFK